MNTDNLILRETDNLPLINKDDTLTNAEIDGNFINIYNDFLSLSQANDPTLIYDVDRSYLVDEFATYNGRLWIATDVSTGVTPIDGSAEWNDVFPTVLAHEKNKDTILDEGGTNETTVAEIRAFIDAGLTSTTNLSLSTKTATSFKIESSTGSDVTIPQATVVDAGLLNAEDKVKLDNTSGINTGDQTLVSLNAEDVDNKVTDFTTINDTLYPTTQAVDTYLTAQVPPLVETFIDGLVAQDLQSVTDNGDTTDNNILFNGTAGILFDNLAAVRKGSIDAGYGGSKGIAQICSIGYELKWEAGRLYVMGDGGTTIREVSHNFATTPSATDDNTKGFIVGSRWILDNGDLYVCTDTTTATAVWVLQTVDFSTLLVKSNNLSDLTDTTTARTNLGLGSLATQSGTFSGTSSGTNTGDQTFLDARIQSVTSSATVTPLSTNDEVIITAQAVGLTLANPTGTYTEGQAFIVRIKDNGTAQSIAYGTNYRGTTLPTTTTVGTTTYIPFIYNSTDGKFDNLSASGITTTIPAVIQLACSDETTALTAGTSKVTFRMPHAMTLTSVRASLNVAGTTSGITTIDINESGVSILSTKLTIDLTEKTSTTAATPSVISDTSLADDSEITIDIDAISGGATEKGLKITLIGTRTI